MTVAAKQNLTHEVLVPTVPKMVLRLHVTSHACLAAAKTKNQAGASLRQPKASEGP